MRKKKLLLGVITVILCGYPCYGLSSEEASSQQGDVLSQTDQQKRIVGAVGEWKPEDSSGSYTVTDLDGNGRLEILSSDVSDDGLATETRMWEVNEEGKLSEVPMPWTEDEDQPDFVVNTTIAFYDADEDLYYYIFEEINSEGGDGQVSGTAAFSLKDGKTAVEQIASRSGTEYFDGDGNSITEEEYSEIAKTRFSGLEEKQVKFNWISTKEHSLKSDVPMEQILELVGEAYSGFSIKDAQ